MIFAVTTVIAVIAVTLVEIGDGIMHFEKVAVTMKTLEFIGFLR
jgi:hypothetical protein